jgi:Fe-S cluster assembly protein SufD
MMIETIQETENYISSFASFEQSRASNDPAWLNELRRSAFDSFQRLGFPTTHDEEWRFTSVAPITRVPFRLAADANEPNSAELTSFTFGTWPGIQLVFVNGRYSATLSSNPAPSKGLFAGSLADAFEKHADKVQPHLARYASISSEPFAALNTAFVSDGAFIHLPKGCVVEAPIHLLFLSHGEKTGPNVCHPRVLVLAEANSQAQVLESYASLGRGISFTNSVTELVAEENAFIDHYKLQRESLEAFHISTVQVHLGRSANVSTQSISLGGSLVRNHVNAVLDGEGGEATLNGFFLVNGRQHVDNHTSIDHAKPHCNSHEIYKGILDGKARGVFNGRIIVRPDAQKTDSKQTNKNLILSEEALVNTNPQLEIYADDVKCTHGATIGQLDSDAIFYLRSRGIDLESARHLLTYAFAGDFINRLKIEPLRLALETSLFSRLAEGQEER